MIRVCFIFIYNFFKIRVLELLKKKSKTYLIDSRASFIQSSVDNGWCCFYPMLQSIVALEPSVVASSTTPNLPSFIANEKTQASLT